MPDFEHYLGYDNIKLAETLTELVKNEIVKRKGRLYCFETKIKKSKRPSHPEKRLLVAQYVSGSLEALTIAEIAKGLKLDRDRVYRICLSFEKKGFFRRGEPKPSKNRLFFASIIRQIMHAGNAVLIMTLNAELRKIIRKYSLKNPRLQAEVRKFFATIVLKYPKYHKIIGYAMERLIRMIKQAKTKIEVLALLELRPFYPDLCTWESAIQPGA